MLVIVTPCPGSVSQHTAASMEKLRKSGLIEYEWFLPYCEGILGRSRSVSAYRFLKNHTAPAMIFLDSDIVFEPEDIVKIVEALDEDHPVVGGLYPVWGGGFMTSRAMKPLIIDGSVREAQYIATGFMGITRSILEKVGKDMPLLQPGGELECYPFFEALSKPPLYISEDWDFCDKVRQIGGKVFIHTGVRLGHVKSTIFWARDTIKQNDAVIIRDLAEYLSEPLEEVAQRCNSAPDFEKISSRWEASESPDQFYREGSGDHYLYDLAGFNSSSHYKARYERLLKLKGATMLDFGCGIGTTSLELGKRNRVVGYDINPEVLAFAKWRRSKMNGEVDVEFTDALPELSQFDFIIAIDVLEHIPDLDKFLLKLGRETKNGAILYHWDSFEDPQPMHYDHSQNIDKWLEEAGFEIKGRLWAVNNGGAKL